MMQQLNLASIYLLMSVRKEQFQGVLTRWEKERLKKQLMEQQLMEERSWMKPKAQPIEIGSASERQEALSRGCMVFRDGDEVIELPLVRPPRTNLNEVRALQGVYKVPGKGYVVLRTWPKTQWGPDQLELYLLEKFKTTKQTGVGNQRPIVTPVEYWVEKDIGGSRHVA